MVENTLNIKFPDDIRALIELNPLAAEQLKNIVLRRRMAELEARLAASEGPAGDSNMVPIRDEGGDGP